jgi:streptogramin lyase
VVSEPRFIDFNADGELYYANMNEHIYYFPPGGPAELVATAPNQFWDIEFGEDGFLYGAVEGGSVVRVDTDSGTVETYLQGVADHFPFFITFDRDGDLWVRGVMLRQFSPGGEEKPLGLDTEMAFAAPGGIAFDQSNGAWVTSYNSEVHHLVPSTYGQPDPSYSFKLVYPGLETFDIAVKKDGDVLFMNNSTGQLLRIDPTGEIKVLLDLGHSVSASVAVDSQNAIYLGMPSEIMRLEDDGGLSHYASLPARDMVFGEDDNLYIVQGEEEADKAIIRVTGQDEFETIATEIDGHALNESSGFLVHLGPAPEGKLYVFLAKSGDLFTMALEGQGEFIANLGPGAGDYFLAVATSAETGDVYFISHTPQMYTLKKIDLAGTISMIASDLWGDPFAMALSPDGKWVYVHQSGAVLKIPLPSE